MIKFFNKYLKEIKIFFSLILIVYLYNKVNFEIFLTYLINLDIFFLIVSFLMLIPDTIILYFKQKKLLFNFKKKLATIKLLNILNSSRLYSLPLPSALGTQFISFVQLSKYVSNKWEYFFLSLFERINFVLVILLISLSSILIFKNEISLLITFFEEYDFIFYILLIITIFLIIFPAQVISIFEIFKFKKKKIRTVRFGVKNLNLTYTFLSIFWYFFYFFRIYFILLSLDIHLSSSVILLIIGTNLLIQSVPISAGGLGLRELTFSQFFLLLNYPFEKGIIIGNLLFIQLFLFTLIVYISLKSKKFLK